MTCDIFEVYDVPPSILKVISIITAICTVAYLETSRGKWLFSKMATKIFEVFVCRDYAGIRPCDPTVRKELSQMRSNYNFSNTLIPANSLLWKVYEASAYWLVA